jgi:hypothetical protein
MSQLKNPMELFKLLPKTNCRKCNEPTCLAFAAAVFTGKRQIYECPCLDEDIVRRYSGPGQKPGPVERDMQKAMKQLKARIAQTDLKEAARRLDASFSNGKLTLKTLGKDFSVDEKGNLFSEIHIHPWIAIPVLDYVLCGSTTPVSAKWMPFRELKGGKTWAPLFGQRCEKPLKKIADAYTDFFEDLIRLFNGRQVENHYDSDISLVLHPLPKVPVLICYWRPEDGLESTLHLFFDETAESQLHIGSLYSLGTGLVVMFEKISLRHGHPSASM